MPVFAALVGDTPNTLPQMETIAKNVFGVVTSLAGIAVFVMFAVGAFQVLTAGNNKENAQKAWATFTYAAIGAAGIILVWLTFLFLKEFTGLDLLIFNVCITGSGDFCQ